MNQSRTNEEQIEDESWMNRWQHKKQVQVIEETITMTKEGYADSLKVCNDFGSEDQYQYDHYESKMFSEYYIELD